MKNGMSERGRGAIHDGNHSKPTYLSHVPDEQLKTKTPHSDSRDKMSHSNLLFKMAGSSEC